jgi:hypothetical protein
VPLKTGTLKFDPPREEAKKLPRYASYAAGIMKTHGGIGFAKNSLNNRMWRHKDTDEVIGETWDGKPRYRTIRVTTYAAILENVEGTWYVLYEIPEGTVRDDLPWMADAYRFYGRIERVTEFFRNNAYYQKKVEAGEITIFRHAFPMSTDEYVQWRIAVERERVSIFPHPFREVHAELEDEV